MKSELWYHCRGWGERSSLATIQRSSDHLCVVIQLPKSKKSWEEWGQTPSERTQIIAPAWFVWSQHRAGIPAASVAGSPISKCGSSVVTKSKVSQQVVSDVAALKSAPNQNRNQRFAPSGSPFNAVGTQSFLPKSDILKCFFHLFIKVCFFMDDFVTYKKIQWTFWVFSSKRRNICTYRVIKITKKQA